MSRKRGGKAARVAAVGGDVRVLLAKPKTLYRGWPFSNDFMRHIHQTAAATYPQLAASIPHVPVAFFDGVFEPCSMEDYVRTLTSADILAMGVVSPTVALDTELSLRLVKKKNPDVKVVLGGHHPTFFAEEWLHRGADVIVRGEGEKTFPRLVDSLLHGGDLTEIPGISYRANGEVRHNPDVEVIKDLDTIPFPDWSVVNWDLYDLSLRQSGRTATLETSRGCSHHCAFCCAATYWKNRQRFKSAGRVVEEIERLHAMGVRQLFMADDNFGVNVRRDREIYEQIIARKLDLSFLCFMRVDLALRHPDLMRLAARAGMGFVFIGYESLSDVTLDVYDKNPGGTVTVRDYLTVYKQLKEVDVLVYGLFVRHYEAGRKEQALSWRSTKQFSDITAQTRFIPMRGVPATEELEGKGYRIKDTFYHTRYLPNYEFEGKVQSSRMNLSELFDVFHPANFVKMLLGSYVERRFFRNLYKGLISDLLHVRVIGVKTFWIANRPGRSLDQRQDRIVDLYRRAYGVADERPEP